MYFDDIFKEVKALWKKENSLKDFEKYNSFVDIWNEMERIDTLIDEKEKNADWKYYLAWAIYGAMSDYGKEKLQKTGAKTIRLDEVPVELIERKYWENLIPVAKVCDNFEFLKKYKGFKKDKYDLEPVYFEDVYNKIRPLWKKKYSLKDVCEDKIEYDDWTEFWDTICPEELNNEFYRLAEKLYYTEKEKFTPWDKKMLIAMYEAMKDYAIHKCDKQNAQSFSIDEIPVYEFEKYFYKNLQEDEDKDFIKKYKGMKILHN